MEIENVDKVKKDVFYAGFGHQFDADIDKQVAAGVKAFRAQSVVPIGDDSVYYKLEFNTDTAKQKLYYNGMATTYADGMAHGVYNGVDTRVLDKLIMQPPESVYLSEAGALAHQKRVSEYFEKLLQGNPGMFYKMAAVHQPNLHFTLDADTAAALTQVASEQVRKQWFPQADRMTATQAANLLANPDYPRSVLKTYYDDNEQKCQTWVTLNFKEYTESGNHKQIRNRDNGKFVPFERLDDFLFAEITKALPHNRDSIKKRAVEHLEDGALLKFTPEDTSKHAHVFVYANAPRATFGILDGEGNPLSHDQFLTEAARKAREERKPPRKSFISISGDGDTWGSKKVTSSGKAKENTILDKHYPKGEETKEGNDNEKKEDEAKEVKKNRNSQRVVQPDSKKQHKTR